MGQVDDANQSTPRATMKQYLTSIQEMNLAEVYADGQQKLQYWTMEKRRSSALIALQDILQHCKKHRHVTGQVKTSKQ